MLLPYAMAIVAVWMVLLRCSVEMEADAPPAAAAAPAPAPPPPPAASGYRKLPTDSAV
jgi:hypothetical protein